VDAIDPRIVRLSVEIEGQFHVFEGFDITARGRKTANPQENSCEVKISNLTKSDRDYILTATSPFIANRRSPKRMVVEAGRKSTGVFRLFYGDITLSQISQPPDIGLTLRFQTGAHKKGVIVGRQGNATQSLSSLSRMVADDLGTGLTFEADDRQIANYSYSGSAAGQVEALGDVGGIDAFVDDTVLVVKKKGTGLKNRVRVLNKHTGMIGVPEFTERGLRVKMLIDADTVLGGIIQVESELNTAANGQYVNYALDFDVASRAEPFYFIAEARRPGEIVRAKKHGR
jgi:hypothetical protein